jgi:hypothetical protein
MKFADVRLGLGLESVNPAAAALKHSIAGQPGKSLFCDVRNR